MPLEKLSTVGLDDANQRRRLPETINKILDHQFDDSRRQTNVEKLAGVTPVNYAYPPGDVRRYGAKMDGVTDDTAALETAILVGSNNLVGGRVFIPIGTLLVSTMIMLPNRVHISGASTRGSIILASSGWTVGHGADAWGSATAYVEENMVTSLGVLYICKLAHTNQPPPNSTYWTPISNAMLYAQAGYSGGVGRSLFDSIVEDITVNANNVAGLGCILSSAWQENSGPRRVLLRNFMTYGIRYQDGFGGASYTRAEDLEVFASNSNTTGTCIDLKQISSVGAFKLHLVGAVASGGGSGNIAVGLNVENDSTCIEGFHAEAVDTICNFDGIGHHTLDTVDGSPTGPTVTVIQLTSSFDGALTALNVIRNGSTNFLKDDRAVGWGTITYDIYNFHITPRSQAVLPVVSIGCNWSGGLFDGSAGSPTLTAGFNVSSITKNGTGDYTITESRGRPSINTGAPWATCNINDAIVRVDLAGASTYRIRIRVGGVATDSNEVKFGNVRLA